MITLKQIRYATAIQTHGNFKSAAHACAISQSALSNAISEMERSLGYKVFERDNKKVLVTPLGSKMLRKANDIYVAVNDLHGLSAENKAPLVEPLTLGVIPTVAPYLLPIVLPSILKTFPQLNLTLDENQSHNLVNDVINGRLDAAIIALPYDCEGLLSFPFWDENFYMVAHRRDPLFKHKKIEATNIDSNRLLLLREGHCLKDHALSVCGLDQKQMMNMRGSSLTTVVELVANQLGTTLIPEMALSALVSRNKALRAVPLMEPGPHRSLTFVIRPNYPRLHDIEALRSRFISELQRNGTRVSDS